MNKQQQQQQQQQAQDKRQLVILQGCHFSGEPGEPGESGRKKLGQGEHGGFLNFKLIPSNVREKAKEAGRDIPAIT